MVKKQLKSECFFLQQLISIPWQIKKYFNIYSEILFSSFLSFLNTAYGSFELHPKWFTHTSRLYLPFLVLHCKILQALTTSDDLICLILAIFTGISVYGLVFICHNAITQDEVNENNYLISLGLVLHFSVFTLPWTFLICPC